MIRILHQAEHVTLALYKEDQPYLATVSHVLSADNQTLYFHGSPTGKKNLTD